LRHDLYFPGVI